MKLRALVLALGITSSLAYSVMLPLWNGFDEPFHFSYLETLVQSHALPRLGQTCIPAEIRRSITQVPVSRFLKQIIPEATSIEEWPHRSSRPAAPARAPEECTANYEAQQAPLAYVLLAPLDAVSRAIPLPGRVFMLRVVISLAATLLLYLAVVRLAADLQVALGFADAALFCIFLTQMLWATVAHIGNDWLAVPVTVLLLGSIVRVIRYPGRRELIIVAALLTVGLWTKAYFIAFIPVFVGLFALRRIRDAASWIAALLPLLAAPWYIRNVILYGSFSGTQESASGIGLAQALAAVPHIPWPSSALSFARWSLWTGDWSFVSFSQATLNMELVLILVGVVLYLRNYRKLSQSERWLLAACALFTLGLVYQTCITWAATHGASIFPEPWYGQGLLVCVWILAFKGFESARAAGRIGAAALCTLAAWIGLATFFWKMPLFYAAPGSRSNVSSVLAFWRGYPSHDLAAVVLGPVPVLYGALFVFLVLTVWILGVLWRDQFQRNNVAPHE